MKYNSFGIFVKWFFKDGSWCWYPAGSKHYSSLNYAVKVAKNKYSHFEWCIKCYPYPFCEDSECKFRYMEEFENA